LPEATEQEEDLLDQGNLCSSFVATYITKLKII
jgi:hypothetical protein